MRYFIATLNGQTFTRSTASRAYTHMTAVRPSYDAAMDQATGAYHAKSDLKTGRWYLAHLEGKTFSPERNVPEETVVSVREYLEYFRRPYRDEQRRPVTDEEVAAEIASNKTRALEALDGAQTAEEYAAAQLAKRIAAIETQKAEGHFDRFGDAGWSSRLDLAQKNAAAHSAKAWWAEAVILEAQEVDGPTFRRAVKAAK